MTTIYCVSKTITDPCEKLNVAANELQARCTKNHLTVHTGNIEAMIFSNANFVWAGSVVKISVPTRPSAIL